MKPQLLDKIHTHQAQIAIIGLGYVGLPLAVAFDEAGFPVVGVDPTKVDAINAGHSTLSDIPSARLVPSPEIAKGESLPAERSNVETVNVC